MSSYNESYDYETLTNDTANIRRLKSSDDLDKSFLANIAISGPENDKIRDKVGIDKSDEKNKNVDILTNFSNYLNDIEEKLKNARSEALSIGKTHHILETLINDFSIIRKEEWTKFAKKSKVGNTTKYLSEASILQICLLEKIELRVRQAIDALRTEGFSVKKAVLSPILSLEASLNSKLFKKLRQKVSDSLSRSEETDFNENIKNLSNDEEAINKFRDISASEIEEEKFTKILRDSGFEDETSKIPDRITKIIGILTGILRPGTVCEKHFDIISSLSQNYIENYYDESASSSNTTDFDKLEFGKNIVSNKLLQRMLALLFVFAKNDLKDKSDIQQVFNPSEEEQNFFSDDNGVWNKSTFKFGKTGEGIEYYSFLINEIIKDAEHPIAQVYKEFNTKIFTSSFAGLDREESKAFFKNFCGNMNSSKMQEVYSELLKPELSYRNIASLFGDRFTKKDKKSENR